MTFQRHQALLSRIGFGGVSDQENNRAKRWSRRLEGPMMLVALWIIVDWYLREKGLSTPAITFLTDWFIWICFIVESSILLTLVDNRRQYLADNWMNILIILAGIPIIWGMETFYAGMLRSLRLLIMFGIFLRISTDVRSVLSRHNLGMTLFISFLIMLFSGFMISGIDPAFESPLDGIWWAWVTITTVGYGDLVPSTTTGRLFGALLILMGIGLFSMLTASFSVFFIEQDEKVMITREDENIRRITRIESKLERIEKQLERTLEQLKIQNTNSQPKEPSATPLQDRDK
ncbi:potassium channel family protein [Neptunomonas antarctica]|uniref:Voltage-gated potassium channel n=1 Tax=Neptunomonas antarctica TaxID=619304 RepID=A0A1N7KFV8_9GAMM|nr:potassium channel family protein [Neptunomonas antarctica]SIS60447.1 voltage-gated potassium channel [Neptunomonas antarctica]